MIGPGLAAIFSLDYEMSFCGKFSEWTMLIVSYSNLCSLLSAELDPHVQDCIQTYNRDWLVVNRK